MKAFLSAMRSAGANTKSIHFVGHSAGAILVAHLLRALVKMRNQPRVNSVSLLAPAATVELYKSHYLPLLKASSRKFGIDRLNIYNLDEQSELDDHVAHVYRKSLLYLVSNSFEEDVPEAPLLGMKKYSETLRHSRLKIHYSRPGDSESKTKSTTHGGFDNDPATMNSILRTVLGREPLKEFTENNLAY